MRDAFPHIRREHVPFRDCDAIGYDYTEGRSVPLNDEIRRRLAA